ncbi:putative transcriptional regulator [Saccharomonospora marina XMU15]|uniref:Putative transcriptional regulator n=1 Tax=Saccharomonospora marina XMU15 TaxID=882083 RepID=H5X2C6_9PSEU|nr:helix-turn-helix transcriptional regulator [Saccharomonospora marina]EHR48722.1 putative transcriptional regulator [Saccharomonospora marina XMU15]
MATRRRRLAKRRKSQGFSQESLAERLGVDPKTIRRWESGETEEGPQPWLRPKLAQCLQVSPEQLEELLAGDDEPATNDRVDYSLRNPAAADLRTVADLRDEVHDLDERYDSAPSTSLLARTGHCLGQVAFLRANVSNHRVRHELLAVEAEAATLMGQLVWDASQRRDHATAHDYFDQAITAAQRLRDPTAEGRALLRKSFVALYGERAPETGLQLTMRTTEVVAGSSHVLAGLALLHTAEAYAMLGRQRDCERALRDADSRIERIGEADAALNLFSPTQPGRLAGSCYLFLGKPKLAQPILETTAHQLRDRSKSQAIVLGNLALAYLRQRRLDEAVGALHRAVDVVEATRGGGGLNIVFSACRELRPWRNVDLVQDVYDRVMTLMTA